MTVATWIGQTIEAFGQSMGFEELALDERGALHLAFENLGVLGLEVLGDNVLVHLTRPTPYADADVYRRALQLCHDNETDLDWVQAAVLQNDTLTFALRTPARDFELSRLEHAIAALEELHETLQKEAS